MRDNLRFGIIGCGRISSRHIQSINEIENAQMVAFADVIEKRAKRYAEELNGTSYCDYRYLLDRKDIDIVSICTPSGMHAHMAIEAMQSGKHVIVEKPMALSLADADRMIAAAAVTGQKMCVVLQNRYNPPMQDLRRILLAKKLGKLLLGNATVRWYRPQEYYDDEWHGTWAMDGGALMNQSIHHIDALQWLMGDIESVFSYTATLAHRMEAEDVGVVALRFKNGALGSIEGSTVTYPENLEGSVAIFGEAGSVKVGGTALNRKVFWKVKGEIEHERELITRDQVDPPSVYGSSHKTFIRLMVESVINDKEPETDGYEGRRSLAVVTAIYASALSGLPVALSEEPMSSNNHGN
jgi:UDP-N-acetyl-2-amino-2-deoxyglucuronate dehydrogenase